MMKKKSVTFVWEATFDLPEELDGNIPSTLDEFPDEFLEEVNPTFAELVDWR